MRIERWHPRARGKAVLTAAGEILGFDRVLWADDEEGAYEEDVHTPDGVIVTAGDEFVTRVVIGPIVIISLEDALNR